MLRPPAGSSLAWSRKDALRRFSRLLTAGAGAAAPAAHRAGDSSFMASPLVACLFCPVLQKAARFSPLVRGCRVQLPRDVHIAAAERDIGSQGEFVRPW